MVADPKAYREPLPGRRAAAAEQTLPVFQAELAKKATYSWNDPPLDPILDRSPTPPSLSRIEVGPGNARRAVRLLPDDAAGRVPSDRRGSPEIGLPPDAVPSLCRWAERCGSRRSGPGTDGDWRIGLGSDRRTRSATARRAEPAKTGILPVDVAGYVATDDRRQARRPLRGPLGRESRPTTTPGCTSGRPLTS